MKYKFLFFFFIPIILALFVFAVPSVKAGKLAQIPTVAIPTVTGTPLGSMAVVKQDVDQEQVNVRAGPSTNYDIVGVLIVGQEVPALGRTVGGDWVQIAYPGVPGGVAWVYSPLINVTGNIPVVEPPPTPTPRTTPTIDPTLAAQYINEIPATRLPTFTQPPPLVIPTYQPAQSASGNARVPMGFVIIGLGVVGLFGTLISLLRGR